MTVVVVIVVCVQKGKPRANGCCASRGREIVSTKASRARGINSAFIRDIYSSWTGSCNCSGSVDGSGETRTFWPRRSNDCLQLDLDAGYPGWLGEMEGEQPAHERRRIAWIRPVFTGRVVCAEEDNGLGETDGERVGSVHCLLALSGSVPCPFLSAQQGCVVTHDTN